MSKYFILCKERVNGLALWWRANRAGYTVDLNKAGKYEAGEAASIAKMRGIDFAVPVKAIGISLHARSVVSVEDAQNFDVLRGYESGDGL